nr:retrotransposon protein, putative, Ty3-gypsy subclass [Tanacetum cinerariifolium]
MPFGLTNATAVFMNWVCKPYLDKFVIVFINDILIYSKSREEHEVHVRLVLELLKNERLFPSFLSANFGYKRYIFSSMWLTAMKNQKYEWGIEQEEAFRTLKENLCNAPIILLPDGAEDFVVYWDVSNQGLGCVLMQRGKIHARFAMLYVCIIIEMCSLGNIPSVPLKESHGIDSYLFAPMKSLMCFQAFDSIFSVGAPVLFVEKKEVMPFGLTNATAVFTNWVCKPYLDKFVIVFINDILIYSKSKEDHEVHVRLVLELLKKERLFPSFLSANFGYKRYIFSSMWLTAMKNQKYEWGIEQEEAFRTLKDNLCNAPIILLPDGAEDFVVYWDVSNQGLRFVLMQRGKNSVFKGAVLDAHICSKENQSEKYRYD